MVTEFNLTADVLVSVIDGKPIFNVIVPHVFIGTYFPNHKEYAYLMRQFHQETQKLEEQHN